MQTALVTTLPPRPEPAGASTPAIGALELLEESERLWSGDLDGALRGDGSTESRHRRRLVLEALAAYVRLVSTDAAHANPMVVFRRWPACTTVAMVALAASVPDRAALDAEIARLAPAGSGGIAVWFSGWAECWSQLRGAQSSSSGFAPHQIPGVQLMLAASGVAAALDVVPEFQLHPETGALVVVFPGAPGRGARVEAGGGACPVADDRWVLPRPVPAATCFDVLGNVHRVQIVDPRDPLLVFDDAGRVIPADSPLPAGEVWIVHLGEPPAEAFDGVRCVLEEAAPPVGWSRWWLGRVSLTSTSAIRSVVDTGQGLRCGQWRPVASSEQADLLFDEPIEGVLDGDGDVVYASPPRLRLPGGPGDVWTIEVRRTDAPAPQRWSAPGGTTVPITAELSRPIIGRFGVHAHAPGKRPIAGAFTVADSVTISATPRIRVLQDGGLAPARVVVRAPRGVHPTPSVVQLGAGDTGRDIRLHIAGSEWAFDLRVELPHCAVRKRTGSDTGQWDTTAPTFTLDDLDEGGALDIRLPRPIIEEIGVPDLLAAERADEPAGQRLRGRRLSAGDVYRYPLGKLVDSARLHGTTKLWLLLPDLEAHVGTVRGSELVHDVTVVGSRLTLDDRARRGRIAVRVCSPYAPWIPPQLSEMDEGQDEIEVNSELAGRSLLVTVAPAEVPLSRWPQQKSVQSFRTVGVAELPLLDSPAEQAMARYLAGRAPLPDDLDALALVWVAAARSGFLLKPGLGQLTAQECASRLGSTPSASLHAAGKATLDADELVEPLIRSGLASHGFRRVADVEAADAVWTSAPLSALLLSSPLLPYLAGAPAWDLAELDAAEERLLATVRTRSHPDALALLTAGTDPTTGSWPGMPEDESDEQAAAPITEALADVLAFGTGSPRAALFDEVGNRAASRKMTAALSLGCALVARIAAQGDLDAAALEEQTRHAWVDLAQRAPALTANDLVHAEFAVSGWYAHHA